MNTMAAIAAVCLMISRSEAQQITAKPEKATAAEISLAARTANEQMKNAGTFALVAVSFKNRSAYEVGMLTQFRKGKAIIDEVLSKGANLTDAEAARYDAKMKAVVEAMDALVSANTSAGGSQGSCFGSCDNQYQGWGHGKGWNRFWCKASCFKIEIHVG